MEVDACGAQGVGCQHGAVGLSIDSCGSQGGSYNSVALSLVGGGGKSGGCCRCRSGHLGCYRSYSLNGGRSGNCFYNLNGLGLNSNGGFFGRSFNGCFFNNRSFLYGYLFNDRGFLNGSFFDDGGCLDGLFGSYDVSGNTPAYNLAFTCNGECLEQGG